MRRGSIVLGDRQADDRRALDGLRVESDDLPNGRGERQPARYRGAQPVGGADDGDDGQAGTAGHDRRSGPGRPRITVVIMRKRRDTS